MAIITLVTTFIATLSYLSSAKELLVNMVAAFLVNVDPNDTSSGASVQILSGTKDMVVLALLVAVVIPRCLSRSIGDHAWISTTGVFAMCFSALFFVVAAIFEKASGCKTHCGEPPALFSGDIPNGLENVATLAFSFSMVFAVFPVLEERVINGNRGQAIASMKTTVRLSIALCCCIYLLVGISGVLTFGKATQSKAIALSNFPLTNPLHQAVHLVVGVAATLLVAIISFPVLASVELLFTPPDRARPWLVLCLGILIIVIDTFLPTKIAFALTGSLGLALGAYIMPCVLFLRLESVSASTQLPGGRCACSRWHRITSVVVVLFGCVLLFGSTPITVWGLLNGKAGSASEITLQKLLCKSTSPTEMHQPLANFTIQRFL